MLTTGALGSQNGIATLLEPGIRTLTGLGLRRRPSEYNKYTTVGNSIKAKETTIELAGMPIAVERQENEPISTFDPRVGNAKQHPMRSFAIGFEYSWESADDELYNYVPQVSRQLGESMAEARELDAIKLINNGFPTGGTVTTYNGETLFNSAHPSVPGTAGPNQSNVETGDIGIGTLQTIITNFENRVDSQGKRMRARPLQLFHTPAYDFLVQEILKSERRPFADTNEINSLMGRLTPTMLHYLSAADIAFVKADLGEEWDIRFFNRTAPSMRSFDDERTRSSVFTLAARWGTGADAWQNIYGLKLAP